MRTIVACLLWLLPSIAAADACRDEVAALFAEGSALDPFQRPPHRMTTTLYDAAGTQTLFYDNVIETPIRTLSGVRGADYSLTLDRDAWTGPSPEGPWTRTETNFPEDRAGVMRRQRDEQAENLSDTVCHGAEDGLIHYTYTTKTNPDATRGGICSAVVTMCGSTPASARSCAGN